jgi:hypothetical protein
LQSYACNDDTQELGVLNVDEQQYGLTFSGFG